METKLTLKLNKRTIEKGKAFAVKRKTSLSKLVENYIEKITASEEPEKNEISPLVQSLSGLIKPSAAANYKSAYTKFLKKKYK